jgi:hypothetical protein
MIALRVENEKRIGIYYALNVQEMYPSEITLNVL